MIEFKARGHTVYSNAGAGCWRINAHLHNAYPARAARQLGRCAVEEVAGAIWAGLKASDQGFVLATHDPINITLPAAFTRLASAVLRSMRQRAGPLPKLISVSVTVPVPIH